MSEGGLGRSTAVMAAGTAVSRALGLVRASVLAVAIGLNTVVADQFALANTLPNILYMLVAGGVVNAVLVPQIVRAYRSGNGQQYADRLLSVSLAILLAITVVATAAAPLIIRTVGGAQDPAAIHLATVFAWWCIPQVFFYGLYTLLGQVLNARGSFGPYMWAPVVNNVVSIVGFSLFIVVFGRSLAGGELAEPQSWTSGPVLLVAGSATLGIMAQALVLLWPLHRIGFTFRPRRDWRGTGLGTAGRVAGWTFAALLAGQVGILVVTRVTNSARVAGDLTIAGNNAYNYAFLVFMLPHSLVTVSLLTALFTRLSAHAAEDDTAAVRSDVDRGLRLIVVYTVIAASVVGVLALPIARLIAPGNAPPESASLAPIIVALAVGLPALGIWSLVQRVHYAYEDARGLFWIQVTMAAVVAGGTVVGRFVLPRETWVVGAGVSIAASYLVGAVWGGLAVRRRLGALGTRRSLGIGLIAVGSAAVAIALGLPLSHVVGDLSRAGFAVAAATSVLVGLVMTVVYGSLLHLLGVAEVAQILRPVARRFGRLTAAAGPATGRLARAARGAGRTMGSLTARASGEPSKGVPVDSTVGQGTLLAGRV
ncbi:MAG TPA: lipid II flippase MurJ, partial [Actinotalea sp.]|nr:lipid II flippase MurJ [Actinotalea sp.]